jgi:cobalt-zinc-cadmium efflux system protein
VAQYDHPNKHNHTHADGKSCDHPTHSGHGQHVHLPKDRSDRSFAIAFFSNLIFALIEVVGGILTQSLAITADAVHDFGDALSIGVAWGLERYSRKDSNQDFNFGYRRFSLFAAMISGVVISSGAIGIAWTAIARFSSPRSPVSLGMAGLAVLGILVNAAGAYALARGKSQSERMLTWHMVEDLLGWVVVLIGAIIMYFTGWTWIDPLLAILLSGFILWNVLSNLKETVYLLLQGRPTGFKESDFSNEVLKLSEIATVDSIRVWSLDGSQNVMSLRVHIHALQDHRKIEQIKAHIRELAGQQGVQPNLVTIETCLAEDNCI